MSVSRLGLGTIAAKGRSLRRHPGYAATVILTLALGIGAVTTVFALVNGVLLSSLPFPTAERLVLIRQQNPGGSWNTSVVDFRAIAESSKTLESVAAMRAGSAIVGSGERAQWVNVRWATAAFFDVMGVMPERGRGFLADEDRVGAENVVVLGQAFAERHFTGRGDPLGQSLEIDGLAHTVVGVMPAGAESWPVMSAELWPAMQLGEPSRRGPFQLSTLARLKPEASLPLAAADLDELSRQIFPLWQQGFQDETARLTPLPLHEAVVGGTEDFLWVAFGAVVVVLLISLVNNANLILMRVAQRAQDLSVRAALGASRWRLARLLMGENLLLVVLGGIAGVALAALLLAEYRALGPAVPRLAEVTLSFEVVGFASALVLLSGIVFSLLPLVFGMIGDTAAALQQARGASAAKDPQRFRDGLVVLEFALALPLLIAAGLLVDSLVRLQRVDPGFEAENLLTASIRLPEDAYSDVMSRRAFWDRALKALGHLPGVRAVGLTGVLPPSCGCDNNFELLGRPTLQGQQPQSPWIAADANYMATLGVRLLEGRMFDSRETPESPPVLLVTESWARRYFPGESAVGKQLYEGGDTSRAVTVIGVVSDVKYDGLNSPGDAVFAPIEQGWGGNQLYVVMRTATDPLSFAEPMRGALQRLDPTLVPTDVAPMATLLRDSLGGQRHWAAVIAGFALSAVLLSAVGVFGVLAYHVAHRQREIGIRQALGANARRIVGTVLRRGLGLALLGVGIGIVLTAFLTRSLDRLLFQVDRTDLSTWIGASALLLLVALVACWLPARRAAGVDPLLALRQE